MTKIIPHLWFDTEAVKAAEFYTSLFNNSNINNINRILDTPSGDCDIVSFKLHGQEFMAISAGPLFRFNQSISFMVGCDSSDEINNLWSELSHNGSVLMPLDKYPFSERYGWVEDRFGLSWQLILTRPEGDMRPKILPSLLFAGSRWGQAEKAVDFYLSVFKKSELGMREFYSDASEPEMGGKVMFSDFKLANLWMTAMDSTVGHDYAFNESVSFIINCRDQEEINYYWEALSADKNAEQCGWLKDKQGVSWQIVPENMDELMSRNPEKTTPAMLKMKKIIIADLIKASKESE